jgi:DNA-directed RNA polymerase specialized sigma24 family protein
VAGSDDIVVLGGSGRRLGQEREEAIEELFRGEYARLVHRAFALLGDIDRADRVAIQAFADLWRHWRQVGDQREAPRYLETAVIRLAREASERPGDEVGAVSGGSPTAPGASHEPPAIESNEPLDVDRDEQPAVDRDEPPALDRHEPPAVDSHEPPAVDRHEPSAVESHEPLAVVSHEPPDVDRDEPPDLDIDRGWREFEALRARRTAARRRNLKALIAVAAVVAVAIAVPLLASSGHASRPAPRQLVRLGSPNNPNAIVARLGLSGVISVAGDSAQAWVIRQIPRSITVEQPAAASSYQLVAIDLRTNDVTYRLNLGRRPRAIAVGVGRVWMTTPAGQEGGQIERLDPASGRVVQKVHLRAGSCSQLSFSFGQLYAACTAWPAGTGIWTINPFSGRAVLLGSPVRGFIVSLLAAPSGVWYVHNYASVGGRVRSSGRPIGVQGPKFVRTLASPGTGGLAYDAGSIWALGSKDRLTRIDELTGKVLDTFSYQNFGMSPACGLDFFTAADGWLWFLDSGCPFSGVLRVSEDTGQPVGGIWIPPNSCGELSCSLIFATPGSIWVPTTDQLIRIEPAAMPSPEPANRPDADSHLPN